MNSAPRHPLLPRHFTSTSVKDQPTAESVEVRRIHSGSETVTAVVSNFGTTAARSSLPNRASMQSLRNELARYNSGPQAQRSQVFRLSSLSISDTPRQGPPVSRSALHRATPSYRSSSDDPTSVISEQDSNKAELGRLKSQESMRLDGKDRIRQLEQRIREQDAVINE